MHPMLKRTVAAAVVAAPMTLALSGFASADTWHDTNSHAGPSGADSSSVSASTGNDAAGGASYHKQRAHAGADGARTSRTDATAGGGNGAGSGAGGASYDKQWHKAGPDGASSGGTHTSTGNTGGHSQAGNHHSRGGLINLNLG